MKLLKIINGVKTRISLTKEEMREIYNEVKKDYVFYDFINYLECNFNYNIDKKQMENDKDTIYCLYKQYDNCEDSYWTIFSNILYNLKRTDFGLNYDYSKLK